MSDPNTVLFGDVAQALLGLGIDHHEDVYEVVIKPSRIEVTRMRRNEQGTFFAAGDEAATVKTMIGIERTKGEPDK